MYKRFLAGIAATVLIAGSAGAADIAPPPVAPVYAPPAPVVAFFTWTGCYLGANVGGLWASRDWTDQIPGDPLFGTDLGKYTGSGVLGGGQAGCNYQVGAWVFGVQADYDWSNATASNAPGGLTLFAFSDQSRMKALASVTGRVGYAWTERFLGYVKTGGAWEQSNFSILFAGASFATASETRGGWTIGIGGEYAFLDWLTGFIEYDYYGFNSSLNSFACVGAGCLIPAAAAIGIAPFNVTTSINVLKVGLNAKFGPGS